MIASHGGTENTGRERIQGAGNAFARTSGAAAGRTLTRTHDAGIVMAAGWGRAAARSSLRGLVRAFWLLVQPLRPFVRTLRPIVPSFWRFMRLLRRVVRLL